MDSLARNHAIKGFDSYENIIIRFRRKDQTIDENQ
jgi:hypothetical protein